MLYQIVDKNGVVINWKITRERAEELKKAYDAVYPESKVEIKEQEWWAERLKGGKDENNRIIKQGCWAWI